MGLLILINVSFGLVLLGISLFLIIKARQTREPIRFIVLTTLLPSLTLKTYFLVPLIRRFAPNFNFCFH